MTLRDGRDRGVGWGGATTMLSSPGCPRVPAEVVRTCSVMGQEEQADVMEEPTMAAPLAAVERVVVVSGRSAARVRRRSWGLATRVVKAGRGRCVGSRRQGSRRHDLGEGVHGDGARARGREWCGQLRLLCARVLVVEIFSLLEYHQVRLQFGVRSSILL